ncbi:hypothetical protein [Candidatus Flexifilum breve]|uniref:hypothetical protein n=1 Tax=Candidatus Flexifilum breve TaxID=3140694 RepID=UPI0031CCBBD4
MITDCAHEGPNVFVWQGSYWMITDFWNGLGVYRSDDAEHWERQPSPLLAAPGRRRDDGAIGGHADIEVQGERAFIFYFRIRIGIAPGSTVCTKPSLSREAHGHSGRGTWNSAMALVTCDRDKHFDFTLLPGRTSQTGFIQNATAELRIFGQKVIF